MSVSDAENKVVEDGAAVHAVVNVMCVWVCGYECALVTGCLTLCSENGI